MRRLFFWALLACYCCGQDNDKVQQLFQRALELQRGGNLEGAVATYKELLQIRSDVPPAHANLGVALVGLGRYAEAIDNYRQALRGGENPATRLNLALAFYKISDFEHAAEEFERVRTQQPGNRRATDLAADCYLHLGQLAVKAEDFKRAKAQAAKAISADATLPEASALSGIADEGLGDYEEAKRAFERAIELDANNFDANLHLGAIMLRDRNVELALRFTGQALRLRPAAPSVLFQMGMAEKLADNLTDAQRYFEAAEKLSPDWLEPHQQLAALYYRLRRPADAQRERDAMDRIGSRNDPLKAAPP
jgi:tetratricopeptide (TPR) repeat protein